MRERAIALSPTAFDIRDVDVVFLALHGGAGEDGRMQAMLDLAGLAYTGSNHVASAAAMDKELSKRLFRSVGVPTPDWIMAPVTATAVDEALGWPVVVKPNKQGSTVGLTVVREPAPLAAAIDHARIYDDEVMIERFVAGREFTVGILDGRPCPSERSLHRVRCSTTRRSTRRAAPARSFRRRSPTKPRPRCRTYALRAHAVLKLGAYSRIDFRQDGDGRPWCLEANSLPGMTATSLLPQAAAAAGIAFPELLERICRGAVSRR